MSFPRPGPQPSSRQGSWGTSRRTEKAFGYPGPLRNSREDWEARIEALEAAVYDLSRRLEEVLGYAVGSHDELWNQLP